MAYASLRGWQRKANGPAASPLRHKEHLSSGSGGMKQDPRKEPSPGRLLIPGALLHVVCCGGLLLYLVAGSTLLGAIGGYLSDPLIQGAGVLLLAGAGLAVWRHNRSRRAPDRIERKDHPEQPKPIRDARQ